MNSAPPLRFAIGRSRIIRIALIAIALAAVAAPLAADLPNWAGVIIAMIAGWYAGRAWIRYEDDHEGRIIARDGDGAWTVDGEPAVLVHHEIVGPVVGLKFRIGDKHRTVSVTGDAISRDDYRRLLVHLRGVHRPDPVIR